MKDTWRKNKNFADGITDVLGLVGGIPGVNDFMGKVFKKGKEKVVQAVGGEGVVVEETGKGFNDEILFREAVQALDVTEQPQIEAFRTYLRKDAKEGRYDAFTLGIAKAIKAFERKVRKTHSEGGGKSGMPQEKTEEQYTEYNHTWSNAFFKRILTKNTNEEKEKFVFEDENFDSLIPKKPKTLKDSLEPVLKKLSADNQEGKKELLESIKDARSKIQAARKKKKEDK